MPKNNLDEFKLNQEAKKTNDIKVIQVGSGDQPVIKPFEFNTLKKAEEHEYSAVKKKFGPLAATDPERVSRSQKDRRFSLNPLLRDPLSIEQEERRIIEEKVRARIESLAEVAKAAAAKIGYQEGLKKGFDESFKKFQAESAANLEKINTLVNEIENAKTEIFQANERFLIELIFKIARMVILKELSTDKEYILRLTRELVNTVGAKDNITIRLNTEDLKVVEMLRDGLQKTFKDLVNINIEASSQVQRGGCQIETEWNAVDAGIDTQLHGIYESIFGQSTNQGGNKTTPGDA